MHAVNGALPVRQPREGVSQLLRLAASAEPWKAALFLVLSFILGVFWFVVLVTLLSTGVGLAVTLIGLPILVGTLLLWIQGARAERWRVGVILDQPIPDPYRPLPEGSALGKLRGMVTDWAVWRDLFYLFLLFPIGIVEFVIVTTAITFPISMLLAPTYYWAADDDLDLGLAWMIQALPGPWELPAALAVSVLGIPAMILGLLLIAGTARLHAIFARALLGPGERAELQAQVSHLRVSRSRVMDAEMMELRRIERDLHDGAQQWLVASAIDLAIAKEKVDSDPAMAKELIDKAGDQARQALAEIRNLVRGISPAILVDRGLDPAISALASRCPIPVEVDIELDERLPETVETTAYFIVAEALTNIAKHSGATEARVIGRRLGDRLLLEIIDNGAGGADPKGGTGLAGLANRAAALDGELRIVSPVGGPTRIRAELPCGL